MLRALENAERSKSGWTWTPHHQYRNVWHGNHKEFAALVEKPWGGYWEWRVWKVRTAKEIASGLDETKREAFRDVEKAVRKRTRFLFNHGGWIYAPEFSTPSLPLHHKRVAAGVVLSVVAQKRGGWSWFINHNAKAVMHGDADTENDAKRLAEDTLRQWWPIRPRMMFNEKSKWKNIGAGEYARSFHGFHVRVKYGRVFRQYDWAIYWQGGTKAVATGSSDTFPGAKKAAEETALSRRTLFNGIDENMKKKGYRWKLTPRSGRFEPLYAKTVATAASLLREYPDDTFGVIDLSDGKRKKPRMLFNAGWIDAGSMGHQREFPDKGLAVVEKMRAPLRGWTWRVYVWMAGDSSIRMGRPGLYGPVKAGWAKVINKAKKDAERAYRSVTYKHPLMLFNTVRR